MVNLQGSEGWQELARSFGEALARREYTEAYEMTSGQYRERVSLEQLQAGFEEIVPLDWGEIGPIVVQPLLDDWPGKQPSDVAWAYIGIGGDVYSEAVTVIVEDDAGELRVREVEFGRP
jgi:hypothetical protein